MKQFIVDRNYGGNWAVFGPMVSIYAFAKTRREAREIKKELENGTPPFVTTKTRKSVTIETRFPLPTH